MKTEVHVSNLEQVKRVLGKRPLGGDNVEYGRSEQPGPSTTKCGTGQPSASEDKTTRNTPA